MTCSISVIVPVYSGAAFLPELFAALVTERERWQSEARPFTLNEVIFVDDAAKDGSGALLQQLTEGVPWARVIHLSRNYGQHPATIAGVLHSSGDWIFTIDEDLQHEPKHFVALLEMGVKNSLDVVYARPQDAVHRTLWRDLSSRSYKALMAVITGNKFIPHFNSFRLMRGAIARAAAGVCSHETYYDIALGWYTDRVRSLVMKMHDRRFIQTGTSGYTLGKLIQHARRMLVSSNNSMLRTGTAVGVSAMAVSVVVGVRVLIERIFFPEHVAIAGWASVFLGVLFFGGLTTLLLAFLLELLTNVMLHTQGKPPFFTIERASDRAIANDFERRSQP